MTRRPLSHAVALAALLAAATFGPVVPLARAQATVEPASLANLLPAPWGGLQREPVEISSSTTPPRAQASARYRNESRQSIRVTIIDEGAAAARVYRDEVATYLRGDVRNEQQKSLTLNGRRVLLTRYTDERMEAETFVADRFIIRAYCVLASERDCTDALTRISYQSIERPRP